MNPRSEPLLWVQLIGLGALPLELLLLVLVLAGGDPGPWPQLERLLAWALGALAPAMLLWRRPADWRSLLLIQSALPTASEQHCRLASLQTQVVPRVLFASGVVALLPLLGWLDAGAAMASRYSPVQDGARLSCMLLAAAVLAVMVWQWQQLVQAIWLLSRNPQQLAAVTPMPPELLERERSSLGLPLLLLETLDLAGPPQPERQSSAVAVAVKPEQPAKEPEGPELDQEVG